MPLHPLPLAVRFRHISRHVAQYQLVSGATDVVLICFSPVLPVPLPLHFLWINIITSCLTSFVLVYEHPRSSFGNSGSESWYSFPRLLSAWPNVVVQASLQTAAIVFIHIYGVGLMGLDSNEHSLTLQTLSFNSLVFVNIFASVNCRQAQYHLSATEELDRKARLFTIISAGIFVHTICVEFARPTGLVAPLGIRGWCISTFVGLTVVQLGVVFRKLPDIPWESCRDTVGFIRIQLSELWNTSPDSSGEQRTHANVGINATQSAVNPSEYGLAEPTCPGGPYTPRANLSIPLVDSNPRLSQRAPACQPSDRMFSTTPGLHQSQDLQADARATWISTSCHRSQAPNVDRVARPTQHRPLLAPETPDEPLNQRNSHGAPMQFHGLSAQSTTTEPMEVLWPARQLTQMGLSAGNASLTTFSNASTESLDLNDEAGLHQSVSSDCTFHTAEEGSTTPSSPRTTNPLLSPPGIIGTTPSDHRRGATNIFNFHIHGDIYNGPIDGGNVGGRGSQATVINVPI